jgi:hypothetical protein
MPLNLLRVAKQEGWAEHESESKERLVAFAPKALPTYIEELVERQAEAGWPTARL